MPSHTNLLHESVDGADLQHCPGSWESTAYMRRPDSIQGRDFKQYAKIRINAMPSHKRVGRGRALPTSCRACSAQSETLAHIVQTCPRTHGGRIYRHDCIVKRLKGALTDKGNKVESEFLYKLNNGNLKPDLVATWNDGARGKRSVVIDVQVVSATNTKSWHDNKVQKCASRQDLKSAIMARHQSKAVDVVAATINWRGVWLPSSVTSLRALGLSQGLLGRLCTRVLRGTLLNWYAFNTSTRVFGRAGVG